MAKVFLTISGTSIPRVSLNEILDVDTSGGQDGYVLTQQADGTFALEQVAQSLEGLSDTQVGNAQSGNTLQYNGAYWVPVALSIPSGDIYYRNRYASEAETLLDGGAETLELYYTAQADGDGLHEDAQSDTPRSGYDIQRKLYYSEAAQADPDTGTWVQFTAIADNTSYASAKSTLLDYLKARTGGTVPISLKMTWEEVAQAPSFTGLLNESYGSGAAAAFGTRRLNGNYSGACMTIRRASDGTTTTIGFVGEEIDESAITTFCTGTTCTVQTWHDQSQTGGTGSGNDATQTTPANQPTIYTGGALVKEGGRLALDFDGTSDFMTASGFGTGAERSVFNILKGTGDPASGYANYWIFLQSASVPTTGDFLQLYSTDYDASFVANFSVNGLDISASTGLQNQSLVTLTKSTSASNLYQDGTTVGSGSGTQTLEDELSIGKFQSNYAPQKQQEIVVYNSDKSTDRTSIEGNISAYYQSAKLLDEAYGSGAAAAYSVRQLKRDNTECMVIRRASDSTTTTIGFDSNGNIDEAAINTFCSGTTCTVYQWLDQSGNGNTATAASQAKEPTIYTGGAIVKENGRAMITGTATEQAFNIPISSTDAYKIFSVMQSHAPHTFLGSESGADYFLIAVDGNSGAGSGAGFTLTSSRLDGNSYTIGTRNDVYDDLVTRRLFYADIDLNFTGTTLQNSYGGNATYRMYNSQELIFYPASSTNPVASIESNVGDYFTQNTPLLDTYTGAAAAYSLRKLRSAFSGSAIRVRRASDNTEQDIGFNVFGELDTVSLASFCSGTDGFVKTWYCQSGNSNDATQTNTANQPKIYDSTTGVTLNSNSKPAVYFQDGVSNSLPSTVTHGSDPIFISAVSEVPSSATTKRSNIYGGGGANDFEFRNWANDQVAIRVGNGTTVAANAIAGSTVDQVILLTGYNISSSLNLFLNGTASASNPVTASYSVTFPAGGIHASRDTIPNYIAEIVVYESDQSSNRTGIESNIATYHGITI